MAGFSHRALFYADEEEFLDGTVPVLRAGLESGEPGLVAVRRGHGELLRRELGEDADRIEFVDMEAVGRNPARIIPIWRDFLARAGAGSAACGIGEPVWPGRDDAELDECRRHERLLNLAFGRGREWSLLCPYDSSGLEDRVLEAAYESHSHAICHGIQVESSAWPGEGSAMGSTPFEGTLSPSPADAVALEFERDDVSSVRELVGREARAASLTEERTFDLVAAVSELAANSVLHGGGRGLLRLWREPGSFLVEVRDSGTIERPLVGRLRPGVEQEGGRGLWMANQLCDLVQIRSGPEGSAVRLRMKLSDAAGLGLDQGKALAQPGQVEYAGNGG